MNDAINVLVVDDSALMRNLISKMLSECPDINIEAVAMNGLFALKKLATHDIDIITLDLEMPEMNGLEFLAEKNKLNNKIPVIVLSSIAKRGARITMDSLALGASDFLLKPSNAKDIHEIKEKLTNLIRAYGNRYKFIKGKSHGNNNSGGVFIPPPEKQAADVKPFIAVDETPKSVTVEKTALKKTDRIDIIAIGISTGGPNALRMIMPALHKELPVPILIVQHMPPGFTDEFARSLERICSLDVKEAEEGDIVIKGRVLIAPGGQHMTVDKKPLSNIVKLLKTDTVNGHRPSVDVLFSSIANVYGKNILAIIMTGMGKDGVKEIGTIQQLGGISIAQSEESCIVPGMPRAAVTSGHIDYVIPLDKIALTINEMAFKFGKRD